MMFSACMNCTWKNTKCRKSEAIILTLKNKPVVCNQGINLPIFSKTGAWNFWEILLRQFLQMMIFIDKTSLPSFSTRQHTRQQHCKNKKAVRRQFSDMGFAF